jgi:hypothetical protein
MIDQNETAICVNCEYHKRMYLKAHNSVIEMQDDLTELWEALERRDEALLHKQNQLTRCCDVAIEVMHSKDQYIEELEAERREFAEFKYMLKSILGMV